MFITPRVIRLFCSVLFAFVLVEGQALASTPLDEGGPVVPQSRAYLEEIEQVGGIINAETSMPLDIRVDAPLKIAIGS